MTMPPRVRWRHFSLRTLFVLMTACCVLLGLWVVYVSPYREQARAIAVVGRLQGELRTRPAKGPGWQRWLVITMLGPDTFVDVTAVDLNNRKLDADDLRALRALRYLQDLTLDRTPVDDECLAELPNFPLITDLSLRYTATTDAGAAHLAQMKKLARLHLTGTHVTDEGIGKLAKLSNLESLFIRWTKITDDGAEKLRKALPRCEMNHHTLINSSPRETQNEPVTPRH